MTLSNTFIPTEGGIALSINNNGPQFTIGTVSVQDRVVKYQTKLPTRSQH